MESMCKKIRAAAYGEPVAELAHGDIYGAVESIFSSSLNIKLGERLLHISGEDKGIGPFSVVVSDEAFNEILEGVSGGESVRFFADPKALCLGDIFQIDIEDSDACCVELEAGEFCGETVRRNIQEVVRYLFSDPENEIGLDYEWLSKEQGRLMKYLLSDEPPDRRILDRWVGRGQGLTPSGDDILVGISAVFKRFGKEKWREKLNAYIIECAGERTTRISYEYLYYAVMGCYSNRICNLVRALAFDSPDAVWDCADKLADCGHTSGVDVMYGVLLAMRCVLK